MIKHVYILILHKMICLQFYTKLFYHGIIDIGPYDNYFCIIGEQLLFL